jgi:hypothetical protein
MGNKETLTGKKGSESKVIPSNKTSSVNLNIDEPSPEKKNIRKI